ncbi:MAG: SRPBCC family protein [Acidimicrobiales bacterium]
MRLLSDQRHRFDVAPDQLWAAMVRVDDFRRWWPWLRRFDASGVERGDVWRATVQPPLPYRVRFDLLLTDVEAPRCISVDVTGDVEGSARLEVHDDGGGSELHFTSDLTPTSRVLRAVTRVAPPVARFGHEWVLDTGLEQFRSRAL